MSYDAEVLADSPRAYWKLSESSGSSFADSSGNSLTLTKGSTGTINYNQTPIAPGLNSCIEMAGADAWLSRAHDALLNLGNVYTLEAWVTPTVLTGLNWANIVDKSAGAYCFGYYNGGAGPSGQVISVRSNIAVLQTSSSNLTVSQPYHLVVTKNGSTRAMYVNGVSVGTGGTNSTCANNSSTFYLGRSGNTTSATNHMRGFISNVAIYPTALSSTRIAAHYTAATIVDPGATLNVNYSQNIKASLDCNLTNLTGTEDVELEYGTSSGVYTHSIPLTATNGTQTKILTGLSEGTTYYARVNIDNTYFSDEEDFTTTEFTILDSETGYVGQTTAFVKWEIDNIYDETVTIVLTDLDDGSSSDEISWSLDDGWNTKKLTGLDYYTNYKAELKINGVIR